MTHKNTPTDGFKAAEAALDKRVLAALAAAWKMAVDRKLIVNTGYYDTEDMQNLVMEVTTPDNPEEFTRKAIATINAELSTECNPEFSAQRMIDTIHELANAERSAA